MSEQAQRVEYVPLPTGAPIWERFFLVAPLVLVGSREPDGGHDLAPKHMAMPLGWQNHYCFVCSPRHRTYTNIARQRQFTVSLPRPDGVVKAAMAAAPRQDDGRKPSLAALPTRPARVVDGVLVEGCYLLLECQLDRIVDGFGENSLIIGTIVAAAVDRSAMRDPELDDADLLRSSPLLAFVSPGRFSRVADSHAFPYPIDFSQ